MYIGKLISDYRRETGCTMEVFARKSNLSKGYISMLEKNRNTKTNGKITPSFETIKAVARAMNRDLNDFIAELDGAQPEIGGTPLIQNAGKIAAHFNAMTEETSDFLQVPHDWLRGRSPENFFIAIVSGDSMFPQYQNGDYIFCLKCADMGKSGRVGVIILPNDVATLKRIEYKKGCDYIDLVPLNPMIPPQRISGAELEQCRVVGRVLRIIRDVDGI